VKPTWIYTVGLDRDEVEESILTGGKPTHRLTSGGTSGLPSATNAARSRTPPAFRDWLLELARKSRV
jgi:hypothetical protein